MAPGYPLRWGDRGRRGKRVSGAGTEGPERCAPHANGQDEAYVERRGAVKRTARPAGRDGESFAT